MNSLTVRARLFGTIALMTIVMMAVGMVGYHTSSQLDAAMNYNFENYVKAEAWLAELISRQRANNELLRDVVLSHSTATTAEARGRIADNRARVGELWKLYSPTVITEEEKELANDFWRKREQLIDTNDEVLRLADAGNYEQGAQVIRDKVVRFSQAAMEAADALLAYQVRMSDQLRTQSDKDFSRNSWLMLIGVVVAAAAACVLGWLLAASILGALMQAMQVAENIAGGQLNNRIDTRQQDEFGKLLKSLRIMDNKLCEIVGQVRTGADTVSSAARQLAIGNDDLSQRTQEQASALEETASSMEEMTVAVKRNSENARQADQLAARARTQADEGGRVVSRAISAMQEINVASKRIADIIGVIDEIAFQTNLLALNAAVEAARAGEQGRGFAVVASEVRSLAQRSATAAKEIKDLIGDTVQKVNTGSELVTASGKTLDEIMGAVKKVADVVAEITSASDEQAAGIEQVNTAVTQMDSVTQQNAALVEEASAASKAMEQQAQELVTHVSFFRSEAGRPVAERPLTLPTAASSERASAAAPRPRSAAPKSASSRSMASRATPMKKASGDGMTWEEF